MAITLEMYFLDELSKNKIIRVPELRTDVTDAEISACMNNIIDKNIFSSSGGNYVGKVKAQIITTSSSSVTLV